MRKTSKLLGVAAVALALASCGRGGPQSVIPPLSAVTINVTRDTLSVGGTAQYSAAALDLSSNPVPRVPFLWTSSDAAIFTVGANGLVTGRGEGVGQLFVEAGGQRDTATILVVPASGGWLVQISNSTRPLNDVFFQSDGRHGCVVGGSGEILTTADAGETWVRPISNTIFNLNAVWFVSDSTGWAVGGNGTAMLTNTGGRTWNLVPTGSSDNLTDVYFATPDTGWVVGSNGVVLRTVDGGTTWSKQYVTPSTLRGVGFAGTHDGWAVGNGGIILGTHDRGASWYILQPAITAQSLNAVVRRSEPLAFAVGSAGASPRTFASPDSTEWELRNAGAANDLEGVSFVSNSKGWAVGSNGNGIVLTTGDGGSNWTQQIAPTGNSLHGVWFVDALRGWAVGDNGRILHTGNGGE